MPKKKIIKKPTKKTAGYGTPMSKGVRKIGNKRRKKSAKA